MRSAVTCEEHGYLVHHRRVARIFCGGGGVRLGSGRYKLVGGVLPRENFRTFGLPWTTFRAFSRWRKRM